ncbi:hypothetical protein [Chitinophaga sancti]|uniref:hypothetical protein n=1 Tax=Chitinophaga sancti TaxID=1004 RepID=UPI003F7B2020
MKRLCLMALLLVVGCKSEFDEFKQKVIEDAKSDQRIDQKEYQALAELAASSNDRAFKTFKDQDGKIDNEKLSAYLRKFLDSKKLSSVEISQGDAAPSQIGAFNVNVFLENSASMDGYVKGVTNFETAIYNLLGDIRISGICDSLNLSYINKSIPYQKKNALSPEIQDFIEKLEPATFQLRGGDRSVSDLKSILNTVLHTVNDRNAAILISDFVFSPGNKANANDYLNNQSVGIKIDFAEKLHAFDLAAVIVHLESNFDGVYYDKTDKPIQLSTKRPYYIWIIGSTAQVRAILEKKIVDNIKGGYAHKLVLQGIKDVQTPAFKIMYKPQIGHFDAKELPQGIITNATASAERVFGFDVAVDFSKGLQDASYYLDPANYVLSDKHYHLKAELIQDKNNPALKGFTHLLHISTDELSDEVLELSVIGQSPSWVAQLSSEDDANIAADNAEKQRTFGFKYLVDGVCDAFYPPQSPNTISKINIQIKK